MPRKAQELGSLAVSRLREPGLHAVGGVSGLRLQVAPSGARSWIMRIVIGGKRSEVGLGGYPDVTLAAARDAARATRAKVVAGVDPIAEFKSARSALAAAAASAKTFDWCAEKFIEAKSPEWSNPKHRAQWTATLATYASPIVGKLLVRDIQLAHVVEVLRPVWEAKTETATRIRARVEAVLAWATANGYRSGPNPAAWKNNLDAVLPKPGRLKDVQHHAAVPVGEVGVFMRDLRKVGGMGARALELAALTAARSGEVRGATWAEIDLDAKTWVIPGSRMKAGAEHRVPLSEQAVALLRAMPRLKDSDLVFWAPRGGQLSDMTLSAVMRRMGVNAVPHGLRSTFRTWAAEVSNFPREVAEHALAHRLPDRVEAAYQRSTLYAKRVTMMQAWADFLDRVNDGANVVAIDAARSA